MTCLIFLIRLVLFRVHDSCRQFLALKVLFGMMVILILLRTMVVSLVDAAGWRFWTLWLSIFCMEGHIQNVFLGLGYLIFGAVCSTRITAS